MAADMVVPEHSLHQLDHKDLVLDAAVGFVVEKWRLFMTLIDVPYYVVADMVVPVHT